MALAMSVKEALCMHVGIVHDDSIATVSLSFLVSQSLLATIIALKS